MSHHHATPSENAFLSAAASGDLGSLERYLFAAKTNRRPVRLDISNSRGQTALMCAAINGRSKAVEFLSLVDCSPDSTDITGLTATAHAILNGHIECAEILVLNGAKLDIFDLSGKTPLHHAAAQNRNTSRHFLTLLIGAGASLDIQDATHGWSALHWAMHLRHFSIMRILLKSGANPNLTDKHDRTPLMQGVLDHQEAAPCTSGIRLLLRNGAELTQKDDDGCTATDLALLLDKQSLLAMLEEHGGHVAKWRDTRKRAT